jgi:hypothetical protein
MGMGEPERPEGWDDDVWAIYLAGWKDARVEFTTSMTTLADSLEFFDGTVMDNERYGDGYLDGLRNSAIHIRITIDRLRPGGIFRLGRPRRLPARGVGMTEQTEHAEVVCTCAWRRGLVVHDVSCAFRRGARVSVSGEHDARCEREYTQSDEVLLAQLRGVLCVPDVHNSEVCDCTDEESCVGLDEQARAVLAWIKANHR